MTIVKDKRVVGKTEEVWVRGVSSVLPGTSLKRSPKTSVHLVSGRVPAVLDRRRKERWGHDPRVSVRRRPRLRVVRQNGNHKGKRSY